MRESCALRCPILGLHMKGKIRMKLIEIHAGKVLCTSLLFLYLTNIIFLFGWLHLWLAVPAGLVTCIGYVHVRKKILENCRYGIFISFQGCVLLCIFILILVWVCGIGGFFPQEFDHIVRNPIYRDLILNRWPVIYTDTNRALCYYFGYWLLPALLSKILFFQCSEYMIWQGAQIVLYVYTVVNCLLICMLICIVIHKKWQKHFSLKEIAKMIFVFGAWGGVPVGGYFLFQILGISAYNIRPSIAGLSFRELWQAGTLLEHYAQGIEIVNGNITQLAAVFNQTIPAWIATMMFLILIDEISVYAYIGFLILISAPYPVIGLGMMMLSVFVRKIIDRQVNLKEVFSVPNLCSIPFFAVAVLFYRKGVDSNLHIVVKSFYRNNTPLMILTGVLVVTFFAFGIYTMLLEKEQKSYLLYAAQIIFVGCYFVGIGSEADLSMRAIIPMHFYFMILLMLALFSPKASRWRQNLLAGLLVVSGVIQLNLIYTLGKKCADFGTCRVPYDAYYTLSNHYGTNDNGYIEQYSKLNPSADLFFGKLCKGNCDITKPIIEYAAKADAFGNTDLYVKKVSIKEDLIDAFIKTVECKDTAALKTRLRKECAVSDYPAIIHFNEDELKPRMETDLYFDEDDFELNWTNYNYFYEKNKVDITASVEVEYKGEEPIQIWQQTNPQRESGISCALYDDDGKLVKYPWAYTYTKHVLYGGQKEKYVFVIPKPAECGRYKLVMMFFYNQNQVYAEYAKKEYLLEIK